MTNFCLDFCICFKFKNCQISSALDLLMRPAGIVCQWTQTPVSGFIVRRFIVRVSYDKEKSLHNHVNTIHQAEYIQLILMVAEMSSLSLRTIVVHKSVTSLMKETNLQKGGFREPNLGRNCKNYFRVYECGFVNINTVTYFKLFLCPFKQRDMSVMTRVPNFVL